MPGPGGVCRAMTEMGAIRLDKDGNFVSADSDLAVKEVRARLTPAAHLSPVFSQRTSSCLMSLKSCLGKFARQALGPVWVACFP